VNNDFRIRFGPESMATFEKVHAQFAIVVNFTIEYDPHRSGFVGERLFAGIEVNDRKSPVAQPHISGEVQSFIIRPTMPDRVHHVPEKFRIYLPSGIKFEFSTDSAHVFI
jgi:hypothetical protein